MCYHAGFGPAAGFVGVDIFFVISGYLITGILHNEWSVSGRIDLLGFYARRFRRLFAALVLVILCTAVISAIVLSPHGEIKDVMRSAAASLVFVSNYYFEMTAGGYFDVATDTLPLLHLWSLAVEEQFYLFWPMLLILVLRIRPAALLPVLAVLTLTSLAIAEYLVDSDPQAAFYEMQARFWELAVGGLIALRPAGQLRDGRAAAYTSLAILLAAVTLPMEKFPGSGAVPAVAGTALLLYAVHGTRQLGKAGVWLRSRPMVFFGLISYSLYLWHWPLLALDKSVRAGPSPLATRLLLCITAVGLAWISHRYVERPFRRSDPATSNPRVVIAGLMASIALALGLISVTGHFDRAPPPTDLASLTDRDYPKNRLSCHYRGDESPFVLPKPGCISVPDKPVGVVIWGDSMALAWQPFAWAMAQRSNMAATSYSRDACPPVLELSNGKRLAEDRLCREFNSRVMAELRGVDTLILSASWTGFVRQGLGEAAKIEFEQKLVDTIRVAQSLTGKIILMGSTPQLRDTVPRCIRADSLDACAISRTEFDAQASESRRLLSAIASRFDAVDYVEPADFFCSAEICPAIKDGYGLYWDASHVSSTAVREFSDSFLANAYN